MFTLIHCTPKLHPQLTEGTGVVGTDTEHQLSIWIMCFHLQRNIIRLKMYHCTLYCRSLFTINAHYITQIVNMYQTCWLELRGKMDGKVCSSGEGGTDGKDLPVCACVCGSAHDCGCVVDGSNAMVAS